MKVVQSLLLVILLSALNETAWCDPHRGGYERDSGNRRPVREVIGEVEHNYRGRVVDVRAPRPGSDEEMYRVRVLQDGGRVKTLRVPADRRRARE
jgi:hypothetical protein